MFYVYAYFDDAGIPIYIGKGKGCRWKEHSQPKVLSTSDSLFSRKLRKMTREGRKWSCRKLLEDLIEEEAFAYERFFILAIGRRAGCHGPLCNSTDGGDRTNTGYRHSVERRRKIGEATKARWKQPGMAQKLGARRGKSRPQTAAHTVAVQAGLTRRRIAAAQRGEGGCVHRRSGRSKWQAFFHKRYLGSFTTEQGAHDACRNAAMEWAASQLSLASL